MDGLGLISIVVLLFTFGMTVVCVFFCMQISAAVRRSNQAVSLFKGQFAYLNERIDELKERVDKAEKASASAIEAANTDIAERIKTARQETLRENDDLKFLLQQLRGKKQKEREAE